MRVEIDVPEGKIGSWAVESFTVSDEDAKFFNMRQAFKHGNRSIEAGSYKQLTRDGSIIMSNTPAEIRDHQAFMRWADGDILINGLGLGVALKHLLTKDTVKSITVIEKSQEVIDLVASTYANDVRVNIIHADAFEYKPPKGMRYNYVWHDIWDNICSDNLPEMTKLHRKYGKKTNWQGSWCKELCKRYKQ